jgi:hypothetical protein
MSISVNENYVKITSSLAIIAFGVLVRAFGSWLDELENEIILEQHKTKKT